MEISNSSIKVILQFIKNYTKGSGDGQSNKLFKMCAEDLELLFDYAKNPQMEISPELRKEYGIVAKEHGVFVDVLGRFLKTGG